MISVKEDIELLIGYVYENASKGSLLNEAAKRVEWYLGTPSCPLIDVEELEELEAIGYVYEEKVSEKEFRAYQRVQNSGVTNMFDVNKVSILSGLTREQCIYIMENYTVLLTKYGR